MGPKKKKGPRKRGYFDDLEGTDVTTLTLEQLQDYARQVYDTIQDWKFQTGCCRIETVNMVKNWRITMCQLKASENEGRTLETQAQIQETTNEKRRLDASWDKKLRRWYLTEDVAKMVKTSADFRRNWKQGLFLKDKYMHGDLRTYYRIRREGRMAAIHLRTEIRKEALAKKARMRIRDGDHRWALETKLRGNHARILGESHNAWIKDNEQHRSTSQVLAEGTVEGQLQEQRDVVEAYGSIHKLYFLHVKHIKPQLNQAVQENKTLKKRLQDLETMNKNIMEEIKRMGRLTMEFMATVQTGGNLKALFGKVPKFETGSELLAAHLVHVLKNVTAETSQADEEKSMLRERLADETRKFKLGAQKARIVIDEKKRIVEHLIRKCDKVLGEPEKPEPLIPDQLTWNRPKIQETAWSNYENKRMPYNVLYELYQRFYRMKHINKRDLGYTIEKHILV